MSDLGDLDAKDILSFVFLLFIVALILTCIPRETWRSIVRALSTCWDAVINCIQSITNFIFNLCKCGGYVSRMTGAQFGESARVVKYSPEEATAEPTKIKGTAGEVIQLLTINRATA